MAYIGVSPSNGVRRKHTYTATANQTSFSGAGAEGATLSYNDSNFVDVYQNGVKLSEADYTSTSGTAIVLAQGASVSDIVEIVVYDVFSVADTVSKADGGTFDGNVAMAGTLGVTGVVTANAGVVVDEMTLDADTLTATDTFTIDAVDDITLNSDNSGRILFGDASVIYGIASNSSSDFVLEVGTNDKDMLFKGQDNGSTITALTLDMSAGGNAIFNAGLAIGGTGAANTLNDYEEGTWTPSLSQPSNRVGTWGSTLVGTYTKVGRKVTVHCSITGSGMRFSATSGYTAVTGFPFAATQPTNSSPYAGSWTGGSVAYSSGGTVYLYASTSYLHSSNSGQASDGVGSIGFCITYFVA